MPNTPGGADPQRIAAALTQFRNAPSANTADRAAKDQLLDELQDAVGLSGRMVTEKDILRRAEALIKGG